ncbi:hypothetical protein D920_00206 [Enterococcus faecalis 13-SD-W-01]|nr:hypothetical protein D920_00206 [Enterococcus faecalis 13-SD-W-01]
MKELKELLQFLRSSRKRVTLQEYEQLTNKQLTFTTKARLINHIQKSDVLEYQKQEQKFYIVLSKQHS